MTEEPTTVRAVYIGSGCFKREDGYLAFVKRVNRPAYLREGCAYVLAREMMRRGNVVYTVREEAV